MGHAGKSEELKSKDPLYALRHSAAHVMAQAVRRLYGPQVKLAIGPPIEGGFYYDMDVPVKLTDEDLPKIEAEMAKVVKENHAFAQSFVPREEALKRLRQQGERYKAEIIEGIDDGKVSFFTDGDFVDLCEGPHVGSTGAVGAFKLLSVAGAYWRGDEHNAQLQRIYGTAFPTKAELDAYLKRIEEAKRRDHRRLGTELELFSFQELAGPGVVFYHPKGALVRHLIEEDLKRRHLERGYDLVATPHMFRTDMWQRSGHLEYYKDYMFLFESEDQQQFGLKPMNCPGHILIYASKTRSYREFPLRFFELGTVYRNEKSGVLHGLLRVRGFTQDDAHIFLREDQLVEEIARIIDFEFEVVRAYGFTEWEIELSTRPEKYIGSPEAWAHAEAALREALNARKLAYAVHEGEGAFYGPKIDIKIKDAIGRSWQCGTIQCDFNLPERFDLTYAGQDGQVHRPIMVHRALLGSLERFLGMLIEHYAGALPVWLAPVQVVVIPIGDKFLPYAERVIQQLTAQGVRTHVDARNEKMQAKIRDAQLQKVPYMAVVGEREMQAGAVAVRHRSAGDLGPMALGDFAERVKKEAQP
ncbi:MAG: threonine--tRNA ligase [Candidatus Omnitrophica bacterium CG11_big_fil_rev_8_21_14_0_20_63_9]|nr:MAG: threonine--tRNA ligase [Candidatus Omnitrophica bacterium CG11_big_fil_rev_8_21_14_0_20_63_9]